MAQGCCSYLGRTEEQDTLVAPSPLPVHMVAPRRQSEIAGAHLR